MKTLTFKLPAKKEWLKKGAILLGILVLVFTLGYISAKVYGYKQHPQPTSTESPNPLDNFTPQTNYDDPHQLFETVAQKLYYGAQIAGSKNVQLYGAYTNDNADTTFRDGRATHWTAEFLDPNESNSTPIIVSWSGVANTIYVDGREPRIIKNTEAAQPLSNSIHSSQDAMFEMSKNDQDCYTYFGIERVDNQVVWLCQSNGQPDAVSIKDKDIQVVQ